MDQAWITQRRNVDNVAWVAQIFFSKPFHSQTRLHRMGKVGSLGAGAGSKKTGTKPRPS